ncbi:unnamed protein product [Periconia digitata]|uniref:Uncharacterized protein n=1 Tax=Periconia digitata TaxID=1303443 RepID=A0A9W4U722_9PLEO|nr:unnamed protein product [Periconia digitata]
MSSQAFSIIQQMPSYYLVAGTLFVGFVAVNTKSLPLAYTVRLAPSICRLLKAKWSGPKNKASQSASAHSPNSTPTNPPHAARPTLFKYCTFQSTAVALDLDINIHKSNSTFFSDADISRAELITGLLSQSLADMGSPAFILAGVQCKFQREIRPYQRYDVSSRILAWTDKAMYVVTYFTKPGTKIGGDPDLLGGPQNLATDVQLRRTLFATLVSKYVFKAGRITVAPEHIFQEAGLLIEADGKVGTVGIDGLIGSEKVGAIVQVGLSYIAHCME